MITKQCASTSFERPHGHIRALSAPKPASTRPPPPHTALNRSQHPYSPLGVACVARPMHAKPAAPYTLSRRPGASTTCGTRLRRRSRRRSRARGMRWEVPGRAGGGGGGGLGWKKVGRTKCTLRKATHFRTCRRRYRRTLKKQARAGVHPLSLGVHHARHLPFGACRWPTCGACLNCTSAGSGASSPPQTLTRLC